MPRPAHTPLVLVLDDDERIQTLLTRMLATAPFATLQASTIEQLKELAVRHRVAAFILDVHLAGESGLDALRWLRRSRRYAATPVLILTVDVNLSAENLALIHTHRAHIFYKHAPLELLREYLKQLIDGQSRDA